MRAISDGAVDALVSVWVSAAFLPSLPAVSVSLSVDVDRVFLSFSFPLGSVLALLLGPEHHVGEGHEHLNTGTKTHKPR